MVENNSEKDRREEDGNKDDHMNMKRIYLKDTMWMIKVQIN